MTEQDGANNIKWNEVLFVAMGNRIKSDDGIGIYIGERLREAGIENIIISENSIENYLGRINKHPADEIIIIDAVDINGPPGSFKLLPISDIVNTTTNTHNLSLDTISKFLIASSQWVLAIQPEKVSFGLEMSGKLREAADRITGYILARISKTTQNIHI